MTTITPSLQADAPAPAAAPVPRLVFEDAAIRVVWQPGSSDFVLVTFGDLMTPRDGLGFFADEPARKAGVACLGFVAKEPHWYPAAAMHAPLAAARPLLAPYSVRVVYGGSMGGYAALKYSAALEAKQVIALCPQWSIDPAECNGHDPGWARFRRPDMAGMGIRPQDVGGEAFLFADLADDTDRFHCGTIARAAPSATIVNVPSASHHVTSVFAGTDNLVQLAAACRARSVPTLRALVRRMRVRSPFRRQVLADRLGGRYGRGLVALHGRPDAQAALGARLHARLRALQASDQGWLAHHALLGFWRSFTPAQSSARAALSLYLAMADAPPKVHTDHGGVLVYDMHAGKAGQFDQDKPMPAGVAPIRVALEQDGVWLFAETPRGPAPLRLDAERLLRGGPGEAPTRFDLAAYPGGGFTLAEGGMFLCAELHGRVVCNRRAAFDWEAFRLG